MTAVLAAQVFLALAATGTSAAADAELLHRAEAAFRAGVSNPEENKPLFLEAAAVYEELRCHGAHNADLYGNQGNAYLLGGDLPQAILAYRRGLRLAPGDPILRANLACARAQVAYPRPGEFGRPPAEGLLGWLPRVSALGSVLLFASLYSLGWLSIIHWRLVRRAAFLAMGITTLLLATVSAGDLALREWSERQGSLHPLVVVAADGTGLRKGNSELYPLRSETPLNRGVEARLRFERGRWLQIELSGGEIGWIPRTAAGVDTP